MKIVYVYPHFRDFGGTERVLIDKMNYFASQEGYEVYSITHEQGNYPMAYKMSSQVRLFQTDQRRSVFRTGFGQTSEAARGSAGDRLYLRKYRQARRKYDVSYGM